MPQKRKPSATKATPQKSAPEPADERVTHVTTEDVERLLVPREPGPVAAMEAHEIEPSDIIPEGDYAGMTYDEVLMICKANAEEALGEMSIDGAKVVIDMLMEEALQTTQFFQGKVAAKEAGIKFCETALPYALLDVSNEPNRMRSWSEAIAELRAKKGIK